MPDQKPQAEKPKALPEEDEEQYSEQEFEESPRQKVGSNRISSSQKKSENNSDGSDQEGLGEGASPGEDDVNEEEVIDVAEKIFIRIADEMFKQGRSSIREVFKDHLYEAMMGNDTFELLSPIGLLEGIKSLGIDDLEERDVEFLLRVLTKQELDGAILVEELLQIMENFGLYEEN